MFQTIVFAYDGSPECRDALKEGIELASRLDARCHLLAVVPAPPALALAAGPLPDSYVENAQADIDNVLAEGLGVRGATEQKVQLSILSIKAPPIRPIAE